MLIPFTGQTNSEISQTAIPEDVSLIETMNEMMQSLGEPTCSIDHLTTYVSPFETELPLPERSPMPHAGFIPARYFSLQPSRMLHALNLPSPRKSYNFLKRSNSCDTKTTITQITIQNSDINSLNSKILNHTNKMNWPENPAKLFLQEPRPVYTQTNRFAHMKPIRKTYSHNHTPSSLAHFKVFEIKQDLDVDQEILNDSKFEAEKEVAKSPQVEVKPKKQVEQDLATEEEPKLLPPQTSLKKKASRQNFSAFQTASPAIPRRKTIDSRASDRVRRPLTTAFESNLRNRRKTIDSTMTSVNDKPSTKTNKTLKNKSRTSAMSSSAKSSASTHQSSARPNLSNINKDILEMSINNVMKNQEVEILRLKFEQKKLHKDMNKLKMEADHFKDLYFKQNIRYTNLKHAKLQDQILGGSQHLNYVKNMYADCSDLIRVAHKIIDEAAGQLGHDWAEDKTKLLESVVAETNSRHRVSLIGSRVSLNRHKKFGSCLDGLSEKATIQNPTNSTQISKETLPFTLTSSENASETTKLREYPSASNLLNDPDRFSGISVYLNSSKEHSVVPPLSPQPMVRRESETMSCLESKSEDALNLAMTVDESVSELPSCSLLPVKFGGKKSPVSGSNPFL